MKSYCLLFALLCTILTNAFSQPVTDSATRQQSYNFYRAKAKTQSAAALVLFFGGLTLASVSFTKVQFLGDTPPAVTAGLITGLGMEIGGIALASASSRNRKKAKKFQASASVQSAGLLNKLSVHKVYYPSLSLKFHL